MIEVLNAYGGIGACMHNLDRDKYSVTHVEINEEIAQANKELHLEDTVIRADAKKYIEENYFGYDYIWASPPCPTHASLRKAGAKNGQYKAKAPDMDLYSIIIFLDEYFNGEWTVENVQPFYDRLDKQEQERQEALQTVIPPAEKTSRHLFWSSHEIPETFVGTQNINTSNHREMMKWLGIELERSFDSVEKRKVLRNCVHPKIGEAILNARKTKQQTLEVQA